MCPSFLYNLLWYISVQFRKKDKKHFESLIQLKNAIDLNPATSCFYVAQVVLINSANCMMEKVSTINELYFKYLRCMYGV